jgi:hypothetical protein
VTHPLIKDTVQRLAGCTTADITFVHCNHTNPVLTAGTAERQRVDDAAMGIGSCGMEWKLVSSSSDTLGGSSQRPASTSSPHQNSNTTGNTTAAAAGTGTAAAAAAGAAASASGSTAELVVDWPAAVEQCAGDEDFLKELLVDLWNESTEHLEEVSHSCVYCYYCYTILYVLAMCSAQLYYCIYIDTHMYCMY